MGFATYLSLIASVLFHCKVDQLRSSKRVGLGSLDELPRSMSAQGLHILLALIAVYI